MKKVQKLISGTAAAMMTLTLAPSPAAALDVRAQEQAQTPQNVALNKPVLSAAGNAARAVDGDLTTYCDGGPAPTELFVDLEDYYDVSSINIVPYYGGTRTYHYEIYTSSDGSVYELYGAKTTDEPQTSAGETYEKEKTGVRYVRVKMTYNSSNPSVHINELRVFGVLNENFEPEDKPSVDPQDEGNIAYGKPTRSTTNNSFTGLVTDGERSTSWSGEDYPKYVDVDLLKNYDLERIRVSMPEGGVFSYNVYTSTDGVHFDRAAEFEKKVSAEEGDDIVFETPLTARVIRVLVTGNDKGEGANSSISEIRAYGQESSQAVTSTRDELHVSSWEDWMQETNNVDIASLKDENGKYDMKDTYTDQDVFDQIDGLVTRLLGQQYCDWFEWELAPNPQGSQDYYEISMNGGKVHIKGNEGLSITTGLNHYLKYYCNVHVSQQTSQTNMPEAVVPVNEVIFKATPYETRYAYNYCTLSYTMPFWGYDEWQREMDYFALNGVNLILDTTATEALWVEYLQNYGYDADEAKAFVCGQSYKAWWLMGNLEGYGGPVSDEWIQDTVQMARTNQRWMTVMGMQPCLQGFMGAMPEHFADHATQVLEDKGFDPVGDYMVAQGDWSGFTRPPILKTTYNGWNDLCKTFYDTQEKIYGQVTSYYAGDLAHEGGIIPPDLSKPEMSAHILNKMMEYDSDAVWVIQSWLSNPNKEILQGFGDNREDHVLILDLDATENPHWSNTTNWNGKEFGGTSWIFCMLDNYGGRTGMHGELEYLATQITKANEQSSHMKGIGITPEGTLVNPVNYDLFWEMGWETEPVDVEEWLDKYIERRYGAATDNAKAAWKILLDTAYGANNEDGSAKYHTGNVNCITNMRPSFNPEIVIGDYKMTYDGSEFEKVMSLMMEDYDLFKDNECWIYDMVDILRQTTANVQVEYFERIKEAYDTGNMDLFRTYKQKMLDSILLLDETSAFQKDSLYGTWISKAVNFWSDERNSTYDDYGKDMMLINAKAICSIWSSKTLQTYGHRQYAGMEADYNYPMWKLWLDRVETAIETGVYTAPSSNVDYFNIGWNMVTNGSLYETEPTPVEGTDEKRSLQAVYEDILNNHSIRAAQKDKVIDDNIAPEGKAYAQTTLGSYTADKINDGNSGSLWIASSSKVPVYVGLTLPSVRDIYGIDLIFEPRPTAGANVMDFTVEIKNAQGEFETLCTGQTYNAETGQYRFSVPLESSISTDDIRVTFTSNGGIYPAMAEMKVYASGGLELLSGSGMFIEDGMLKGVPDGWTPVQIRDYLRAGSGEIRFEKDGVQIADEEAVPDGTVVSLVYENRILDSLTVSLASNLKNDLLSLVERARLLSASDYSPASWTFFAQQLASAEALLEEDQASSAAYSSARVSLLKAMDLLVNTADLQQRAGSLQKADLSYISEAARTRFNEELAAVLEVTESLESAGSTDIYTAYGHAETAENLLLPEKNANIASQGAEYASSQLSGYYSAAKMVNGNYDDCWVANSQTVFPSWGGVKFDEGKSVDTVRAVFEQNGYRNTRIGFTIQVQTLDGAWHDVYAGTTGSKTGYTFQVNLKEAGVEEAVQDVRVTMNSYATDAGSPYPGVAELEIYETKDLQLLQEASEQASAWTALQSPAADSALGLALKKADYVTADVRAGQALADEAAAEILAALPEFAREALQASHDGLHQADWTPSSWQALETVWAGLEEQLASASLEELEDLRSQWQQALDALQARADFSGLQAEMQAAGELNPEDWTADSWQTLSDLLEQADAMIQEAEASQAEADALSESLHAARLALVAEPREARQALEALVKECEGISLTGMTESSKAAFEQALQAAKDTLADPNASEEALRSAADSLSQARAALKKQANKTLLGQAVATAEQAEADGALETLNPVVRELFAQRLEEARAVLEDAEATQDAVNSAWRNLVQVIQMLDFTSDKTQLAALVAECDLIDVTLYRPEGRQAFLDALDSAHDVLESDTALDAVSIKAAYDGLLAARNALVAMPQIDTSLLQFLADLCHELDLTKYAAAGQETFLQALEAADAVLADPQSQEQVDAAVRSLNGAYLDLRLLADESLLLALQDLQTAIVQMDRQAYSVMTLQAVDSYAEKLNAYLALEEPLDTEGQALLAEGETIRTLLQAPDKAGESTDNKTETLTPGLTPDADPANGLQTPADPSADQKAPVQDASAAKADASAPTVRASVRTAASAGAGFFSLLTAASAGVLAALKKRRNK